ncbi:MAG: ABC transporter permease subunit [Solibacillus sp.]|uniref:ABC transporter permease n=1 Tax=Solibacillus sp. TaxID=1909654 RepID=UPI00331597C9
MNHRPFNPVLLKEIKLRFRNAKSFSSLAFYLIAITLFILAYFIIMTGVIQTSYMNPTNSFILFCSLTVLQMGLLLFMAPALTAGAISTEREKQTLNILLTTTQTSTQIIIGKLVASLAYLVVLLIATLPMYSILFLFGGVSPTMLGSVFLQFLLTVFAVGSVGILFSTVTKKTILSMISTYGVVIFLTFFTAMFFFVGLVNNFGDLPTYASYFWLSINPIAVVLSVISPDIAIGVEEMTKIEFPPVVVYTIFYSLLGIGSLLIAVKKLRIEK